MGLKVFREVVEEYCPGRRAELNLWNRRAHCIEEKLICNNGYRHSLAKLLILKHKQWCKVRKMEKHSLRLTPTSWKQLIQGTVEPYHSENKNVNRNIPAKETLKCKGSKEEASLNTSELIMSLS